MVDGEDLTGEELAMEAYGEALKGDLRALAAELATVLERAFSNPHVDHDKVSKEQIAKTALLFFLANVHHDIGGPGSEQAYVVTGLTRHLWGAGAGLWPTAHWVTAAP